LIPAISIPSEEKVGSSGRMAVPLEEKEMQVPISSSPKADPTGPLICHRLVLRLVSWVKLSTSEVVGAVEAAPAGKGTTTKVTREDVARIRSIVMAKTRCNWNPRAKFPSRASGIQITYGFIHPDAAPWPRVWMK